MHYSSVRSGLRLLLFFSLVCATIAPYWDEPVGASMRDNCLRRQ